MKPKAQPTILVVDDDKGLARLVEKALRREGFKTATATSGAEAIDWLAHQSADLMLLDLKLQDLDGKELVHHLKSVGRCVPFVIITGQGDERVAVEMMKGGALDYLVKDVRFQDFVPTVVRRALEQLDRERRLSAAEDALRREHALTTAVLNTSGALVAVLDPEGRIVQFNRACEQATGYSLGEVRGKRLADFLIPGDELHGVQAVFGKLRSGKAQRRHENHWVGKDGKRRLIDWSISAICDEHGGIEYFVKTGIDITERKRLEKEILEISDREQRRIGQDLHDGLCQRLAGIELMSEVLAQRLEGKRDDQAVRANEIARNVRESIDETRLLARGLSPVLQEPEGLMAALQELASNTAKVFSVDCLFKTRDLVLLHDQAVATHLFRIAQEAVSNAIKHGKASLIQITLDSSGGKAALIVEDNGKGMANMPRHHGGMGLHIMRYRAGMIGGVVEIRPRITGGTTVSCSVQERLTKG
jgi:PAS domain S-box-containing protein